MFAILADYNILHANVLVHKNEKGKIWDIWYFYIGYNGSCFFQDANLVY